jgi:general secretion pathway protein E/type IV pilus assembly protein PilB
LLEQQQKRRPLGWLLAELGFADEAGVQDVVAEQLACQRFDPVQHRPSPQALALLAEEEARRQYLLPLAVDAATQTFLLSMAQPFDPHARALCDSICPGGMRCEVLLAGAGEIEQAISQHYPSRLDIDTLCAWWRRCLRMPCARGLRICTFRRSGPVCAFVTVSTACC